MLSYCVSLSLWVDDVPRAWLVWSGAETALADAYRFPLLVQWSLLFSGIRSELLGLFVTLDVFHAVQGTGLGDFHHLVSVVHRRLSDFIHGIVVHRRYGAIPGVAELVAGGSPGSPEKVASARCGAPCSFSAV